MKPLIFSVATALALASPALADDQHLDLTCTRYKSKCAGKDCYTLANGMKADPERRILSLPGLEELRYVIAPGSAAETMIKGDELTLTKRKYQISYEQVSYGENDITISNHDAKGADKERVIIEPVSGFYAYYLLHTDGSIKDVPIGEPYRAYFGWCASGQAPATPAAPPAPPAVAAPPAAR